MATVSCSYIVHLPLQAADKRRRQGTQGQRQVGAGLWTEKVDIVYNWDSASRSVAWLGSSHKTGAVSNASLFPRLARAAPIGPGLPQKASWELLLLTGQGWMTCLSSPQTYPSWGRLPRGVDRGPPGHVGVRCSAEHGGNDEVPQGACMSHKTPTKPQCPRQQSLPAAV